MVVVPLLCAIFDVSTEDAMRYVVWSTGNYRANDMEYKQYVHMPETEQQIATAKDAEAYVRNQLRIVGRK